MPHVPQELLPPPPVLVSRSEELGWLHQVQRTVAVVTGLPGVGKRALALTWAEAASAQYPDGQLHLDLADHAGPGGGFDPESALAALLRSMGIPEADLPPSRAELGSRWRTLTARRRILLFLTGVRTEAQVRELLPGGHGSRVVVASQRRIHGLEHAEDLQLAPLGEPGGIQLLAALAGEARVAEDPAGAAALVRRCAGLPAALRVVARMLSRDRFLPLGRLAGRLGDGELAGPVFEEAYQQLGPEAQQLYRMLGQHELREVSAELIGAFGLSGMEELLDACLADQVGDGRYELHDLLLAHARTVPGDPGEASAALDRWTAACHHYLNKAGHGAFAVTSPRRLTFAGRPAGADPFGGSKAAAMGWFEAEYPAILAVARMSALAGDGGLAWQFADVLSAFFFNLRRRLDWIELTRQGILAAAHSGRIDVEARLRSLLSRALLTDDEAARESELSVELAERAAHPLLLASVWEFRGRHLEAAGGAAEEAYRKSYELNLAAGDRRGAALAQLFLGRLTKDVALLRTAIAELDGDERMIVRAKLAIGQLTGDQALLAEAASYFAVNGMLTYEAEALQSLGTDPARLEEIRERLGLVS
ncbi:hypothetical protein [Longispora albida]|uniref:hypothetical protein n=1 Tax=Longispora albida TaxID=203523 RepID=UPI00039C14B5|nr:hypothetical protein [Longispora albida]